MMVKKTLFRKDYPQGGIAVEEHWALLWLQPQLRKESGDSQKQDGNQWMVAY